MNLSPVSIAGFPMLEKLDKRGNVISTVGPWKNVITDSGLDFFADNANRTLNNLVEFGKVGTGTSPVTADQTSLVGYAANVQRSSNALSMQSSELPYFVETTSIFNFPLGGLVGTYGCVGVSAITGNSLHAGSQIQDSEGNPTTITLTNEEQLRLTYRLRMYAPTEAVSRITVPIDGVDIPATLYIRRFTAASGNTANSIWGCSPFSLLNPANYPIPSSILDTDSATGGTQGTGINASRDIPYVPGSGVNNMRFTFAANTNNFASGINLLRFNTAQFDLTTSLVYDVLLDTPIMKTNLEQLIMRVRSTILRA